ncbi:MAG TPA: hypothetical protein PKE64_12815 [Anaerolineae bacterium]|nr:hypothetical protein [Anaerolineae bacterium]
MVPDVWDKVVNLSLVATLGLVVAGFFPLLYSVWETYVANEEKHTAYRKYE